MAFKSLIFKSYGSGNGGGGSKRKGKRGSVRKSPRRK